MNTHTLAKLTHSTRPHIQAQIIRDRANAERRASRIVAGQIIVSLLTAPIIYLLIVLLLV